MDRVEELKKVISKAQEELSKLETAQIIERNKVLIGKCYKIRNSFGSSNPEEKWWLYKKVIRINENGHPLTFEFEMMNNNQIEIRYDYYGYSDGAKEISQEEFTRAWNNLLDKIDKVWKLVN